MHGEEESSGRNYVMLEGTDARVHFMYHTPEMEVARNHGGLRTNSFIRLQKSIVDGRPALEITDLGDSEAILTNKRQLREIGQRLLREGIVPQDDGWGGWLGRYQRALRDAVTILETPSITKRPERDKHRDFGR